MTDIAGDATPQTPPAAPAAPPAAPADQQPAGGEAIDYAAHPAWKDALAPIPDMLRGPLVEAIGKSEAHTQKAIEQARQGSVPGDWQQLYREAEKLGLTPAELGAAYQAQEQLGTMLRTDPDGFLDTMTAEIDKLVQAGEITRRQGAQMKQQAQQKVDEETDPLLTEEQRQLKELQQWREQEMQRQQAEQQRQQEAQQQEAAQQAEEQFLGEFWNELGNQLAPLGLATHANGQITASAGVDPAMLETIASRAGAALDQNPRMSPVDAIKQSIETQRRLIESTGGTFGAPKAAVPPVVAGGPVMPGQAPAAKANTMEERQAISLATIEQMLAAGD
jgi:hypothetical protein